MHKVAQRPSKHNRPGKKLRTFRKSILGHIYSKLLFLGVFSVMVTDMANLVPRAFPLKSCRLALLSCLGGITKFAPKTKTKINSSLKTP